MRYFLLIILVLSLNACTGQNTDREPSIPTNTPGITLNETSPLNDIVVDVVNNLNGFEDLRAEYSETYTTVMIDYLIIGNSRSLAENQMGELMCMLRNAGLTDQVYQLTGMDSDMNNQIIVRVNPPDVSKLNCDNDGAGIDWEQDVEFYYVDETLNS